MVCVTNSLNLIGIIIHSRPESFRTSYHALYMYYYGIVLALKPFLLLFKIFA